MKKFIKINQLSIRTILKIIPNFIFSRRNPSRSINRNTYLAHLFSAMLLIRRCWIKSLGSDHLNYSLISILLVLFLLVLLSSGNLLLFMVLFLFFLYLRSFLNSFLLGLDPSINLLGDDSSVVVLQFQVCSCMNANYNFVIFIRILVYCFIFISCHLFFIDVKNWCACHSRRHIHGILHQKSSSGSFFTTH